MDENRNILADFGERPKSRIYKRNVSNDLDADTSSQTDKRNLHSGHSVCTS
jgi:hypothetical protein